MLYEIHEKILRLQKAGKKVIDFNFGDPDQSTDKRIIDAAIESINEGDTHYGSASGDVELRQKLAEFHNVKAENVIVSPGSKWSIYLAMYLLAKGGNVILPSPHWTAYEMMAKELGIQIKFLKRNLSEDWDIKVDELQKMIDDKTKMIIVTSPDNPTSKSVSDKTMKALVELANEKKIPIMSDETYADIAFAKRKRILDFEGDHIMTGSFSKTFAMTGWRIGYIILNKQVADKMTKFNQMTITSIPTFIQKAGLKALELRDEISNQIINIYKKRAETATKIFKNTKLKFSEPDAPFYIFPDCGTDAGKFALELLDKQGVAVTPGISFGDYNNYFRLALTMPEKDMKRGLEIIADKFK